MTFRLVILSEAKAQIDAQTRWWAEHHSSRQAARWLDAVEQQLASLCEFPESHALSAENHAFPYEIRDKLLGLGSPRRHRAVFTIRGDTVFVIAVRQAAEDAIQPGSFEFPPQE